MAPYHNQVDIAQISEYIASYNETTHATMNALGFGSVSGFLRATNKPEILDQLTAEGFTKPGIIKHDVRLMDEMNVKELDKMTIN